MHTTTKKMAITLVTTLAFVGMIGLIVKTMHSARAATPVAVASFTDKAAPTSGTEEAAARQEIDNDYTDFVNKLQKSPDRTPIPLDFLPPGTKCAFHWVFPQHTASLTVRRVSITGNTASTDIELTTRYVTDGSRGPAMPAGSRVALQFSEQDHWTKVGGRWILTSGEPNGQTQATLNDGPLPADIPTPGTEGSLFIPSGPQ